MERKVIDWEAVELDYRCGVKTLRQMAEEQGITHGAINKRAKRDKWTRDLSSKIRAKAEEKVSRTAVSKEVSRKKLVTENDVVEANATMQANKLIEQRHDIQRLRILAMAMGDQLEHQTESRDLYEQLGELMASPDEKGVDKLNELYRKAMSLPSRVDTMKKLADTLKTLIALEREAFGIDRNEAPADALSNLLRAIGQSSALPVCDDHD